MWSPDQFDALFRPRGVVVVGASTHPGKFGFVALHNLLAANFRGRVWATNRAGEQVLGATVLRSLEELPPGEADLAVLCTPASANVDFLKTCAERGIRAAVVVTAGYGETDGEGASLQLELADAARSTGVLLVGPNCQGVVSTTSDLCAQIVAPYPPAGRIGIVSQSGNFVSSLLNLASHYGVGVSHAASVGNAAVVDVADCLEYFAHDDATTVGIGYVEGVADGRAFMRRVRGVSETMPIVLIKGGVSELGSRAAASHTGSLATDSRLFDGAARQAGAIRANSIESAYDIAATFATQPMPSGPRVAVVTTVGGWGVLAADALAGSELELAELSDDLVRQLEQELPARWGRNNPIDLAGGETRDTIPKVLEAVAGSPDVDAVLVLGMGVQGNQARLAAAGPFYPDHGLERIVEFHRRQDRRYVIRAAELRLDYDKPVVVATELSITDRSNPAVTACRESGIHCHASAERAVQALDAMWRYARWRRAHDLDDLKVGREHQEVQRA